MIGALALLVVLVASSVPASAHSAAENTGFSQKELTLVVLFLSPDGTDDACPPGAGPHCPLCCQAGACSLIGCILAAESDVSPIFFDQAVYDTLAAPRPDTAAPPPDPPPPRSVV